MKYFIWFWFSLWRIFFVMGVVFVLVVVWVSNFLECFWDIVDWVSVLGFFVIGVFCGVVIVWCNEKFWLGEFEE